MSDAFFIHKNQRLDFPHFLSSPVQLFPVVCGPTLGDAELVLLEIRRMPGAVYTALVPNVRGPLANVVNTVQGSSMAVNCHFRPADFDALRERAMQR